jgi:purine-nucleoside phosphorylase
MSMHIGAEPAQTTPQERQETFTEMVEIALEAMLGADA